MQKGMCVIDILDRLLLIDGILQDTKSKPNVLAASRQKTWRPFYLPLTHNLTSVKILAIPSPHTLQLAQTSQ